MAGTIEGTVSFRPESGAVASLGRLMASLRRCNTIVSVCDRVYELLPLLSRVDRASVMLFDPGSNGLMSNRHLNGERSDAFDVGPQPLPMSISGRCFLEESPIVIHDCRESDLIPRNIVEQLGLRSSLAVPLRSRGGTIGVLRLDDCSQVHRFSDADIQWFVAAGEYIGLALENVALLGADSEADVPASARLFQSSKVERSDSAAFDAAFENAPIGMCLVSPSGNFLRVNRVLCEILGYEAEQLLQVSFQNITHPDDLHRDLTHLHQLLKGEIPRYRIEKRYFHREGHPVWVELNVSLVRNPDGSPRCFVSQIESIAARKAAEAAQAREMVLVQLLEGVAHLTASAESPETLVRLTLRAVCLRLEWTAAHCWRVITEGADSYLESNRIWHLPANPRPLEAFCEATEARTFRAGEGIIGTVLLDRRPVWRPDLAAEPGFLRQQPGLDAGLQAMLVLPVMAGGRVAMVLEFFMDRATEVDRRVLEVLTRVTERLGQALERDQAARALRALHEELSRSHGFVKAVMDSMDAGVVACDPQGRLTLANRAAEQIHGGPFDLSVPSRNWPSRYGIFRADGTTPYPTENLPLVRALRGETVRDEKCVVLSPSGRRTVLTSGQPVTDDSGLRLGAAVVMHDVTASEDAENVLQSRTRIARLLQDVSIAANEALNSDAALRRSAELVCHSNGWQVGHVLDVVRAGAVPELRSRGIWLSTDPARRLDAFRRASIDLRASSGSCLPGLALASGNPEWIADLAAYPGFSRGSEAAADGLVAGFAFPVLSGTQVVAVLEFFATKPLEVSDWMVEAMANIGAQLGRAIEREQARIALDRWAAEAQAHSSAMALLTELTALLRASATEAEALAIVRGHGALLFPEGGSLSMPDATGSLRPAAAWGSDQVATPIAGPEQCWALRTGKPFRHRADSAAPACAHARPGSSGSVCVPVAVPNRATGILHVETAPGSSESDQTFREKLAVLVAEHLALALAGLQR